MEITRRFVGKFESEELSVTWYSSSNNIYFTGTFATDLKNLINERLKSTEQNFTIIVEESIINKIDEHDADTNSDKQQKPYNCNKMTLEMAEVKLELAM